MGVGSNISGLKFVFISFMFGLPDTSPDFGFGLKGWGMDGTKVMETVRESREPVESI